MAWLRTLGGRWTLVSKSIEIIIIYSVFSGWVRSKHLTIYYDPSDHCIQETCMAAILCQPWRSAQFNVAFRGPSSVCGQVVCVLGYGARRRWFESRRLHLL